MSIACEGSNPDMNWKGRQKRKGTKEEHKKRKGVPPQHVTLLRLFQNQHQLINTIDLILNTLNKRAKSVRNIVNKRIRYPIGRYADVVLELLYASTDILRVRCWAEMKLYHKTNKRGQEETVRMR